MSNPMKQLPKSNDWQMKYEWHGKEHTLIRATMNYDCGCVYAVIMDRSAKILEFDMGDTLWCEEHDPTMPWVEEYDYKNKKWDWED